MIQLTLLHRIVSIVTRRRSRPQQYGGAQRTTETTEPPSDETDKPVQCITDSQGQVLLSDLSVNGTIQTRETDLVEVRQ